MQDPEDEELKKEEQPQMHNPEDRELKLGRTPEKEGKSQGTGLLSNEPISKLVTLKRSSQCCRRGETASES